ncbi:MAG: non-ribosomal peptide synthetase [Pseudomonadales bacterium]
MKNHTSPVAQIDLLSAAEKAILISDFNPISQALDPDSNLISLFEEQADQMPDELAISFLSKHTTYRQLRQRTNQFAHFLLNKKGVLPGDRVAISCELSDWVLVTMMAILKAGAAFVPIDPEAPDARKQFLQQDSDVVLVVDDVFLMEAIMELSNFPDTNPEVKIDAEELAYIIYTSGTTGQAKGVMIPHRSIYNSMLWQKNETKMDSGDVMLQLMNYSFDGFILVAFLPLISGGALLIADQDTRKDPEKIAQLIESNYITNLYTIPVQFSSIIDSLKEPDKVQLKRSVFCGDKLDGKMISRCKDILPNVEFFNAYGPTENAIVSTMSQRITEDGYFGIGTPIDNTNVFIVNEELMLQPLGVVGEIGLSGLSLAKGYLNQDELTQEKFVPNPYIPGTRLYLTGDLGRWRSDGRLEFVGRKDDQVKVGGQRVELQELKHHLNAYDQIIESVVLARKVAGEITLVAFYRSKKAISSAELRRFLGNRIPQYMIPAHFRLVKEFPMTQNSKLDTAKLLAMDLKPIDDRVPPKNPLERQLLSIWSDLLEVPPEVIGVNHNFFQIGGNSMKLVKMHQQIMDVLKADIPVSAFFEFTTIESLSHYIQNVQTTGEHPSGEIDDQVKEADEMLKLLNRDDV